MCRRYNTRPFLRFDFVDQLMMMWLFLLFSVLESWSVASLLVFAYLDCFVNLCPNDELRIVIL